MAPIKSHTRKVYSLNNASRRCIGFTKSELKSLETQIQHRFLSHFNESFYEMTPAANRIAAPYLQHTETDRARGNAHPCEIGMNIRTPTATTTAMLSLSNTSCIGTKHRTRQNGYEYDETR